MLVHRLSPLDASFLAVESPTAHMHVGWAAFFAPPAAPRRRPGFEDLRDHIAARLDRAPAYRQRLAPVPLDMHDPVWVDDEEFAIERHVRHWPESDLATLIDGVMSVPLARDRPLWEMWIADGLEDGRIAVVGKAHHCMVDGIGAVQLGSVLLDATPETPPAEPSEWTPAPAPGPLQRLGEAIADRVRDPLALAAALASPSKLAAAPASVAHAAVALARAALPPAPPSALNRPGSPRRHLAMTERSLADIKAIKRHYGTTVNDVVLAAAAGALRRHALATDEEPRELKAMVPVSVRDPEADGEFGNRISFMFLRLPCDEPDPELRLLSLCRDTAERKRYGEPEDADAALQAIGHAPPRVRRTVSRLVASPRMFNVVVSNIPGPPDGTFMLGCKLEHAYPVVPLAAGHALSIGFTTIGDRASFGLYADSETLPDADAVATGIGAAIDELHALATAPRTHFTTERKREILSV